MALAGALAATHLGACASVAPSPPETRDGPARAEGSTRLASTAGSSERPTNATPERDARARCALDDDCRLDASTGACAVDPSLSATTPLVDQGTTCLCDAGACRALTARPVACEGDHSCAVRLTPRPHPVARGLSPADLPELPCSAGATEALRVTCERTNLCTLHRSPCKGGPRAPPARRP